MRKSFTNINGSNSFFVLHDGSSNFIESLTHTNHASIRDLVTDFATQVNTVLVREGAYSTSTVTVNSPLTANDLVGNGVFDFSITNTDVPHGYNDGDLELHANVSLGDFYRLLGVKRSKVDND
eukprot:4326365-Pleurochrysis_carterae.AAC.1